MPRFTRYLGIDYSGAEVPTASLPGLRVFSAEGTRAGSAEVRPPPSVRRHWTRRGLAHWLAAEVNSGPPALIGIDHGFSFPLRYFERHHLPPDWPAFLDDFHAHWPTDADDTYVCFVRDGLRGNGHARLGDPRWLRLTEEWTASAKSVFQFDVQGQVANSTHAGLPWLRFLRQTCGERLHFWPFDGWDIPRSAYETVPRDLLDIASDTSASARDRIRAAEALSRLLAQRIDAALHLDRTQRLDSNSATERVEILNEITDEQLRAVAASIVLPVRLPQVSE